MAKLFNDLRERLLRAGVARASVRLYLAELADHLADLTEAERRAGRGRAAADAAALFRLGEADGLAKAMIERRQFQAWSARAPWAIFGLAPLVLLAGAYLGAGLILWSGWKMFLPGANTPFVPIHGPAVVYFGLGKLAYFGAPLVIGWTVGMIAARQRSNAVWPMVGLMPVALIAGAVQFHAVRSPPAGAAYRVWMDVPLAGMAGALLHSVEIFLITATPYVIWRLARARLRDRPAA